MTEITSFRPISAIISWFNKAKPNPNEKDRSTQLGVHIEEVAEMLELLYGTDQHSSTTLSQALFWNTQLANLLKNKPGSIELSSTNRELFADALCDQIVTATGVGVLYQIDMQGALSDVAESNASKFDDDGLPILNKQGKIMKGPNYRPPALRQFI